MFRKLLATSVAAGLAALAITTATHKGLLTTGGATPESAVQQEMAGPIDGILTLFGADWCGWCEEERAYLQQTGIPFRYICLETREDINKVYSLLDAHGVLLPAEVERGVPLTINRTSMYAPVRAAIGFIGRNSNGCALSYFATPEGTRQLPLTQLLPLANTGR